MMQTTEQIGADWIAYARSPSNASEQEQTDAMSMHELSFDDPELAWSVIKYVFDQYPEGELLVDHHTEAQGVIGLIAAGPLEDLLERHGHGFIDRVEGSASSDFRMRWALRGMYTSQMAAEVQIRVEKAMRD